MKVEIKVRCPFCDKDKIKVIYTPEVKRDNLTNTVNGKRTKVFSLTKEHYDVIEDCKNCGASVKKIEKALNTGKDYKTPSRKKILERMRKAGLPSRI